MRLINRPLLLFMLGVLLFLAGLLLGRSLWFPSGSNSQAHTFQKEISLRQKQLADETNTFLTHFLTDSPALPIQDASHRAHWAREGLVFLVYQHDSLVYWSDNQVPFPQHRDTAFFNHEVHSLGNGWYLSTSLYPSPGLRITGLALIKHTYPYENDYLKNEFHPCFSSRPDDRIQGNPPGTAITNESGTTILYYTAATSRSLPASYYPIILTLFLSGFILLFLSAFHYFRKIPPFRDHPSWFLASFTVDVLLIRFLTIYFRFPEFLYSSDLFSPFHFAASAWLPSLGDLFINITLLLFLSLLFYYHMQRGRRTLNAKPASLINSILHLLLLLVLFAGYVYIFHLIVLNSSFSLITSPNPYGSLPVLLGFISLGCLSLILFFISVPVFLFQISSLPFSRFVLLLTGTTLALGLALNGFGYPGLVPAIFFWLFFFLLYYASNRPRSLFSLPFILLYLILLSFLSTFLVLHIEQKKEISQRKLLAQKLSTDRDPLAEYLVDEAYNAMKNDTLLLRLVASTPINDYREQRIIRYVTETYFSGFWSKYNLEFTLCNRDRILNVVIPYNTLINCQDYFSQMIKAIGKPSLSPVLRFMDYGSGSLSYLGVFPLTARDSIQEITTTLYLDITSKRIPKGLGYPELLISKESRLNPDINQYSYAIFKKGSLVRSFGKYSYPLNISTLPESDLTYSFFDHNAYNHLQYRIDKDKILVLSMKNRGFLDNMAPFSYFSFLISILALIVFFILMPAGYLSSTRQNFQKRLQLSMILLILFSFVIIGITSGIFIVRLNQSKNTDSLTEKAHSILIEIQQKLGKSEKLTPDMSNDLFFLLNKFSLIFFTDINLYDLTGTLIASSRPLIFEEGLISTRMNPVSYQELTRNQKSLLIHKDRIGSYQFLSAYLPFRNEQDKLVGYLNLPYFARQDEIRTEVSAFLVAFINIYVILVAISIFIAILISRYITKPLLLIREKLKRMKLGIPNEKIEYSTADEIGGLIEEYNLMVDKLARSADQLAQSEREGAWREMARQVAHEIKNPLTPMKLSIQHLLKAYDEKAPDWDARLKRFSQTLIDQIENLSAIASGFSDFAQMPQMKMEKVDMKEVMYSLRVLYLNHPDTDISIVIPDGLDTSISGDKNQLIRVFSNLFRNALQAIETGKKGLIHITFEKQANTLRISFSDNGSGIPEEQQHRIFSPNFTTKTGGMGLGLAMVKSIVGDHGGQISFTSEAGAGTTFYLDLPVSSHQEV